MTKTKFTPEQKIQIVLESIKTNISIAELCRKHNVHPTTFQIWRRQFLDAGKARLARHGNADSTKASKRDIDDLERIIGELTIANDVLKNLGGKQRLGAVRRMQLRMSLAKSLKYAGVSNCAWYYKPKTRKVRLDQGMVDTVSSISAKRLTYGMRQVAAQISRETGVPVNRK